MSNKDERRAGERMRMQTHSAKNNLDFASFTHLPVRISLTIAHFTETTPRLDDIEEELTIAGVAKCFPRLIGPP